MWVMKWRWANTVNSKMVINILLNDKMYFQWTVESACFNEDDRNLPTKGCSTTVAGWGFWRRIISGVTLRVENQLSKNAQFGNSRAECPGLLLGWICSGEATELPFREAHVSLFSLSISLPFYSPSLLPPPPLPERTAYSAPSQSWTNPIFSNLAFSHIAASKSWQVFDEGWTFRSLRNCYFIKVVSLSQTCCFDWSEKYTIYKTQS